jgi:hypothetical protein
VAQDAASWGGFGAILLPGAKLSRLSNKANHKTMATLTTKETALLLAISEGMDEPDCGWLHEVEPFNNDHVTAGVLGALMAKGLVTSYQDDETPAGYPPAFWVETTESGKLLASLQKLKGQTVSLRLNATSDL